MRYEVVRLLPERVACYRYVGGDPHPEGQAMQGVLNWAKERDLLPPVVDF